jgi:hypothetical protein
MVLPPELVGSDMANTPCKKWRLNVESRVDRRAASQPHPLYLALDVNEGHTAAKAVPFV